MSYEIEIPQVESARLSPNPVDFNTKFLISVEVIEKTITLEPQYYYSGEIYAGEV